MAVTEDLRVLLGKRVGLRLAGQVTDGSDEENRLRKLGVRLLPPFPGEHVIKPAIVPPPELLPELLSYQGCVELLVAFYRGALEERFSLRSSFGRGDVRRMKNYSKFCLAVDAMSKLKVAPAAWILFSFDVWRETGVTKGPPTTVWTFSVGRIIEKNAWFQDWASRYRGGRSYFADEHLKLVRAWRAMWDDLMITRPADREELVIIVEKHFPADSYEKAVLAAQISSQRLGQYLLDAINNGRMVWA